MKPYVYPHELQRVHENIKKIHKNMAMAGFSENEIYELVKKLVKKEKNSLKTYVKLLSKKQCIGVASYIPYNNLKLDCTNLFATIEIAGIDEAWWQLFLDFQNCYTNHDVADFLCTDQGINILKSSSETNEIDRFCTEWLSEKDKVCYLCNQFGQVGSKEDFQHNLRNIGLSDNRKLYISCMDKYMLYCSKDVLLATSAEELVSLFDKYNADDKILFIVNILKKIIDAKHLRSLRSLYQRVKNFLKIKYNEQLFFLKMNEENLMNAYKKWANLINIEIIFSGDKNRIAFWSRYAGTVEAMDIHSADGSMYFEFKNCIITEFKGKAAGPVYIYSKTFFKLNIFTNFIDMKKSAFQSYQYNLYSRNYENENIRRLEHKPSPEHNPYDNWMHTFKFILKNYYGVEQD